VRFSTSYNIYLGHVIEWNVKQRFVSRCIGR